MNKEDIRNTLLKELTKEVEFIPRGKLRIENYLNTGFNLLNFILSGEFKKGIPEGQIVMFAGEEMTGKTLFAALTAVQAEKESYLVLWLDSEGAVDDEYFDRIGMGEHFIYKRVGTIEDVQNILLTALKKAKVRNARLFIVLDSLGNIASMKEVADSQKGEIKSDMGQRAKGIRSAFRRISPLIFETKSIFILINHIYKGVGPYDADRPSGGLAPLYLSGIVLMFKRSTPREGKMHIYVESLKNRFYIPKIRVHFTLEFQKGISEEEGLIELGQMLGVITNAGGWWDFNGKKYRKSKLVQEEEFLNVLEQKVKEYTFARLKEKELPKELQEESPTI